MKRTAGGAIAKLRAALGTGRGRGDAPKPDTIAAALDATAARGGAHLDTTVAVFAKDSPASDSEALVLRVTGDDDLRGRRAEFVAEGLPGSSAVGIALDTRVHGIKCDWTVYLDTTAFRADVREKLDGMTWVAVDVGPEPPASGAEANLRFTANHNPARFLFYAAAATTEEKLGYERVGDVETAHYRGTLDIGALGRGAPATYVPGLELDAQLRSQSSGDARVEAWIDGDGVIRRLLIREAAPQNPAAVNLTDVHLSRFGQRVDPRIPDRAADPAWIAAGG